MNNQLLDSSTLCWSSSSFLTCPFHSNESLTQPLNSSTPPSLPIKAAKKCSEVSSQGLQKQTKKDMSRILRTEAAIKAIERKSKSSKYNRLWPKAVLDALDDAIRENSWESAIKIFALLRKQHWYEPRCQTYTKLLVMLGKCRQPKQASLLFEIMRSDGLQPTVDVYTALVSAYGFGGQIDEAFRTVDDMKSVSDCKPDVYTYSILINCCCKLRRFDLIQNILAEMSYLGIEYSTVTYNILIDGYGKAKQFGLMENTLTDMIERGTCLPDIFTFNSFIGAYGKYGKIKEMEKWYNEFQLMGINPDIKTFNVLITSYGKAGMYEKMISVLKFMSKRYYTPTVVTYNIVIETYGRVGNIEEMEKYFLKMKHQGMKPNSVTYCSLVNAYSKAGILKKFDSIMRQVENSDVVLDTPFFNCIISAYGQAGDIKKMGELFLTMKERYCRPDNFTFSTMIQVYKAQGMIEAAEDLENKMITSEKSSGLKLIGC
ncbi:hypothetical protein NMG60_11023406 [Bertholletia excelsa]